MGGERRRDPRMRGAMMDDGRTNHSWEDGGQISLDWRTPERHEQETLLLRARVLELFELLELSINLLERALGGPSFDLWTSELGQKLRARFPERFPTPPAAALK